MSIRLDNFVKINLDQYREESNYLSSKNRSTLTFLDIIWDYGDSKAIQSLSGCYLTDPDRLYVLNTQSQKVFKENDVPVYYIELEKEKRGDTDGRRQLYLDERAGLGPYANCKFTFKSFEEFLNAPFVYLQEGTPITADIVLPEEDPIYYTVRLFFDNGGKVFNYYKYFDYLEDATVGSVTYKKLSNTLNMIYHTENGFDINGSITDNDILIMMGVPSGFSSDFNYFSIEAHDDIFDAGTHYSDITFDVSPLVFDVAKVCKDYKEEHNLSDIHDKLFLAACNYSTFSTIENTHPTVKEQHIQYLCDKLDEYPNIILKVCDADTQVSTPVLLGAYLSSMNLDKKLLQDYCFTEEVFGKKVANPYAPKLITKCNVIDDNNLFTDIKNSNRANVIIEVANKYINIGGNTGAKEDLSNYFAKIILTQTLTSKLFNILKTKIKYNANGLNTISSAIINELESYVKCGYLTTDKTYTGEDIYDDSGKYLLLPKNTVLSKGYAFKILPFTSLTPEQKQNHEMPNIYIFLADSYGIRSINIKGTVY